MPLVCWQVCAEPLQARCRVRARRSQGRTTRLDTLAATWLASPTRSRAPEATDLTEDLASALENHLGEVITS